MSKHNPPDDRSAASADAASADATAADVTAGFAVRPEELLAHRPWVHSLALALVRDPNRAADLEQDTWATALDRPPTSRQSLRGWLGTVMRNRLRDEHRVDERRGRREAEHGRRGASPSAAELAGQADLHRRVIEVVLGLPSTSRDVVLLRYFEGLSANEVAVRQGVPASTVRTRTQRALVALRERLDTAHGGDGKRWRAALAPLAEAADPSASPDVVDAPPGPLRTLVPVAAMLAIAVIGVWAWQEFVPPPAAPAPVARGVAPAPAPDDDADEPRRPRVPRERPGVAAPSDEPPADEGAEAAPGEESPSDEAPVEEQATPGVIELSVTTADGRPAVGAQVSILPAYGAKGGASRTQHVTDVAGRIRITFEESALVRLFVRSGAGADATAGVTDLLDVDLGDTLVAEVRLGPVRRLAGLVRGPSGEVVPNAYVALETSAGETSAFLGAVRSGALGRFEFPLLPEAEFTGWCAIDCRATGFLDAWREFKGGDDAVPRELELTLGRAITVRGRCVDEGGKPLAGIDVSCTKASARVTTAADGRFEMTTVPPEDTSVLIETSDFYVQRVQVPGASQTTVELGDLVLRSGGTMRGRVVYSDGTPAPNASLNLNSEVVEQFVWYGGTDDDGRFEVPHVGPGDHTLYVLGQASSAPGGRGERGEGLGLRAGRDDIVVQLSPGQTIRISLVDDATGEPVKASRIGVKCGPPGAEFTSNQSFYGDDRSTAEVTLDEAGTYDVRVQVPGYEETIVRNVGVLPEEPTPLVVRLRKRAE